MEWVRWVLLIGFGGTGLVALVMGAIQRLRHRGGPGAGVSTVALSIGAVFVLAGIGTFLITSFSLYSYQPAKALMDALKVDDYGVAFEQCQPRMQQQFDGMGGFAAWAEPLQVKRFSFHSVCGGLEDARADGSGRFESGERFSVTIYTTKRDGVWKIEGIYFWSDSLGDGGIFAGHSNGMECFD